MVLSIFSALVAVGLYKTFEKTPKEIKLTEDPALKYSSNLSKTVAFQNQPVDFTYAAAISTPTVVNIQTKMIPKINQQNPYYQSFRYFFGDNFNSSPQPKVAFGSGVIITNDGYIITNNHVVKNGDEIEVTLHDKSTYSAKVVGTDESTDLAIIKIDAQDLPAMQFANSDQVKIGEWVLAVGNPFNLTSTVTAGIVSAKGRDINILKGQSAIESFIQTDAAVNPGNSGGALVNLNGELIGINTAIATPTGTYAGYSFAVPTNLVQKVFHDIVEYGIVQRGYLGISIREVNSEIAEEKKLKRLSGVYVDGVAPGSAADDASIKQGDIILQINGMDVNSPSELQEQVAKYHPGDNIAITVLRDDNSKRLSATLKNLDGNTEIVKREHVEALKALGVEIEELSSKELKAMEIDGGVKIRELKDGKLRSNTSVKEGFVITKIDNKPIRSREDLIKALENKKGGVMLEGRYPGYSGVYYYAFGV